jgi:HEAT repeat protein
VPAVAALLTDKELSHIGRYALERMPCPEAVKALRDALPKTKGLLKVGVVNSLGVRRDAESTKALVALLGDSDQQVAAAAAAALGAIGSSDAAKALAAFQAKAPEALRLTVADARLTCAERLLADGKKLEAMAIYKALSTAEQPKHVRLAAQRGLLAAVSKK